MTKKKAPAQAAVAATTATPSRAEIDTYHQAEAELAEDLGLALDARAAELTALEEVAQARVALAAAESRLVETQRRTTETLIRGMACFEELVDAAEVALPG